MVNGYLFDTNITIAMIESDPVIIEFIRKASRDKLRVYFSVVTECEFISGLNSEQEVKALKFLNTGRFIEVSSNVARTAGYLRRTEQINGRKIKTPDALIMATAIEHKLILVSRDKGMSFIEKDYGVQVISP